MADVSILTQYIPPVQFIEKAKPIIDEFTENPIKFKQLYRSQIDSITEVTGKGFKPVAVMLGGLTSIAGVIVSFVKFDTLKYIITSEQVEKGEKGFELSHQVYMALVEKANMIPVIIDFMDIPSYIDAERLFRVLAEGAIIVQGVTAEVAAWLGANSGCGRLLFYRPKQGKGIFRYL